MSDIREEPPDAEVTGDVAEGAEPEDAEEDDVDDSSKSSFPASDPPATY